MSLTPFSKRGPTSPKPAATAEERSQSGAGPAPAGPTTEGVPLASIIPRKIIDDDHLIVLSRPKDAVSERFRRLRTRLELPAEDGSQPPQVIMVTSSVPDEGKTTTAFNLALAYAEERQRSTVIVDLDLRRPSVGSYLTPAPHLGVTELLTESIGLEHALITITGTRLNVLPAGKPRSTPTDLLRSASLRDLFDDLRRRFDWVIVDTPPVVPFSDATVVQGLVDGTLLIVRAGTTPKATINRAIEALDGGHFLGVVLNDVLPTPVDRYYYRYDDYDPYRYAEADERSKDK